MKQWRSALAAVLALVSSLIAPAPSALGQALGQDLGQAPSRATIGASGLPRRPIPYGQLTRAAKPKPASTIKATPKTAKPVLKAKPKPAASPAQARTPKAAPARRPVLAAAPAPARRPVLAAAPARTAATVAPPPRTIAPASPGPVPARPPAAPRAPAGASALLPAALPPATAPPPRPGARLAPADPIPPAELEAFVDGVVREGMAAQHVAGVVVSVVQNGQVVLAKGYGDAALGAGGQPGRPVDPNASLFRLGSTSTLLTALEAAKAVEQGRLKLGLPVNVYLQPALRLPDEDVKRPVLIRHLLSQTAGFEERTLGRLYQADATRMRSLGAALAGHRPARVAAPGERASLSAYGTALLGAALANSGRRPFDQLMEAELLLPLGMTRTSFREPYPARAALPQPLAPALAAGLAQGYRWTGRGFSPVPIEFAQSLAPGASASSTGGDMARLMIAMLSSGGIGGAQAYGAGAARLLRTPMQKTALGLSGWPGGLVGGALPGGFQSQGFSGGTLVFRNAVTVAPDLRLGVFAAANTETGGPLAESLAARITERFYATPRAGLRSGDPALARNAGGFNGRYASSQRSRHGLERVVDRLLRAAEVRVTADGRLAVTREGQTRLWSPEFPGLGATPTRFRAADGDEPLVFALDGGRIAAFTPASNTATFTRVSWFLHPATLALGALAVGLAAVLSLGGLFVRAGRELRRTDAQAIGAGLQAVVGAVWLAAFACFGVWRLTAPDLPTLSLHWPGGWLIAASSLALAATIGSVISALQLLEIWRSDRRRVGWKQGRQLRHTATAVLFLLYGLLLTLWGALTPWSP